MGKGFGRNMSINNAVIHTDWENSAEGDMDFEIHALMGRAYSQVAETVAEESE